VFAVRYELDFYISEDDILHSYRRENIQSFILISVIINLLFDGPYDGS
jgi:hypothetical protein